MSTSNWSEHTAPDGRSYYYNAVTRESTWERPAELPPPMPAPLPNNNGQGFTDPFGAFGTGRQFNAPPYTAYGGFNNPYTGFNGNTNNNNNFGPPQLGPGPPIQKGKQAQGPNGCNLFVFHIPNSMTTRELFNLFSPFGNVISARIMVERDTGRSRGFGFVSFDNMAAADAALRALDGHPLGSKRLKVSHKKGKDTDDMTGGGVNNGSNQMPGQFTQHANYGNNPNVGNMGNDGSASSGVPQQQSQQPQQQQQGNPGN